MGSQLSQEQTRTVSNTAYTVIQSKQGQHPIPLSPIIHIQTETLNIQNHSQNQSKLTTNMVQKVHIHDTTHLMYRQYTIFEPLYSTRPESQMETLYFFRQESSIIHLLPIRVLVAFALQSQYFRGKVLGNVLVRSGGTLQNPSFLQQIGGSLTAK